MKKKVFVGIGSNTFFAIKYWKFAKKSTGYIGNHFNMYKLFLQRFISL